MSFPKSDPIWNYSNPSIAKKRAKQIYNLKLYRSETKTKKYYIITPDNKKVNFGAMSYEDYTKHKDEQRKERYLKRASKIKGDWMHNEYSPNNLAMHILWGLNK